MAQTVVLSSWQLKLVGFQIFTSPYVDFLLENGHKQVAGFKTVGLLFLSSLGKHIEEQAKTSIHDSISINLKTWEAVYFLLNDLSKLRMIFKKNWYLFYI